MNRMANKVIKNDIVVTLDCSDLVYLGVTKVVYSRLSGFAEFVVDT